MKFPSLFTLPARVRPEGPAEDSPGRKPWETVAPTPLCCPLPLGGGTGTRGGADPRPTAHAVGLYYFARLAGCRSSMSQNICHAMLPSCSDSTHARELIAECEMRS
jgi:hypothetical protein